MVTVWHLPPSQVARYQSSCRITTCSYMTTQTHSDCLPEEACVIQYLPQTALQLKLIDSVQCAVLCAEEVTWWQGMPAGSTSRRKKKKKEAVSGGWVWIPCRQQQCRDWDPQLYLGQYHPHSLWRVNETSLQLICPWAVVCCSCLLKQIFMQPQKSPSF